MGKKITFKTKPIKRDYEYNNNAPIMSHDNDMLFPNENELRNRKIKRQNILDW